MGQHSVPKFVHHNLNRLRGSSGEVRCQVGPGVDGDDGIGLPIFSDRLLRFIAPVEGKVDHRGITKPSRGRGILLQAVPGANIPVLQIGVNGSTAVASHPVSLQVESLVPTHLNRSKNSMYSPLYSSVCTYMVCLVNVVDNALQVGLSPLWRRTKCFRYQVEIRIQLFFRNKEISLTKFTFMCLYYKSI